MFMSTGISVALAALGAILSFAVADNVSGVDVTMVGYIVMAAGVLGLVISVVQSQAAGKRHTSVTEQVTNTPDGTVRTSDAEVR
jgi:hypothetical protein